MPDVANDDNSTKLVEEAYRLSERNLESELSIALAADQRAASFCGFLVAATAIMVSLADEAGLSLWMQVVAASLIISSVLTSLAARSVKMYAPGSKLTNFDEDFENNYIYTDVLRQVGAYNDKHSAENRKMIKCNGRLMNMAISVAIAGLVVGVLGDALMGYMDRSGS